METTSALNEESPIGIDWRERFYDAQTQSIKEDIRRLNVDVNELRQEIERLNGKTDRLNEKIDNVNKNLNERIDNVNKEIHILHDKINENLWKTLVGMSIILGIFHYLTK